MSRVRMPIITVLHLKRLLQVMVNLEAQKNVPSWDRRLKRKQYSLARMVFSQYEHELRAPEYEELMPVCSNWVMLDPAKNLTT